MLYIIVSEEVRETISSKVTNKSVEVKAERERDSTSLAKKASLFYICPHIAVSNVPLFHIYCNISLHHTEKIKQNIRYENGIHAFEKNQKEEINKLSVNAFLKYLVNRNRYCT